ncbi:hypothetical protein [Planctellipticum variicoloris]|nr:hypothetical protein SH412_001992 [Planctomycetaceae bacterium SH412]
MPTDVYIFGKYIQLPSMVPSLAVVAVAAIAGFVWFFLFWYHQRRP